MQLSSFSANFIRSDLRVFWIGVKAEIDSLRLRIKCLRALANFATIANEAQISHLWQHILQDTGAFDKYLALFSMTLNPGL